MIEIKYTLSNGEYVIKQFTTIAKAMQYLGNIEKALQLAQQAIERNITLYKLFRHI